MPVTLSAMEDSLLSNLNDKAMCPSSAEKECTGSPIQITEAPHTALSDITEDPPDGGRGWIVVVGAYLALFSSFGVVNSYGVFQDYYETEMLASSSSSTISLIGALQLFLLYVLSPVVGRYFDTHGISLLMPAGTALIFLSMMLTSVCQKDQVYQFFLSQGLLFGVGNALIIMPALGMAPQWFKRKRAYAIGIVVSGSSLGGVIYPLMLQQLIPSIGFGWAVRVAAFVSLACLLIACATMRTRIPLKKDVSLRNAADLTGFKSLKFCLIGLTAFLNFYALFIPYYYVDIYADYHGVSPNLAKYQVAILNAAGVPARVIPGLLADRIGPLNILIPCAYTYSILIFSLWLPARGTIPITLFSALYGLFSGPTVSLIPSYIASTTPVEKYGARLGSIWLLTSVATLIGTPTGGAFLGKIDQAHFDRLMIFAGALVLIGAFVFTAVRYLHSGRQLMFKV